MARCYNCGCDIPDDDKMRLCDECKGLLLPFIKMVNASSSSGVRRLVSNEDNLRTAGVTDGGMEYLLRLCELHDKSNNISDDADTEPEETAEYGQPDDGDAVEDASNDEPYDASNDASNGAETDGLGTTESEDGEDEEFKSIFDDDDAIVIKPEHRAQREERPDPKKQYRDIEVPADEPLRLIRKGYGEYLTAAEIVLGIVAFLLVVWFVVDLALLSRVDFASLGGAIIAGVMIYVTDTVRKMLHDTEEVKKHFR